VPPVDVWHRRDDTIVKCKQAKILAAAIPGAQRHFLAGHGHFSLVFTQAASYLEPFRAAAWAPLGRPAPTALTRTALEQARPPPAGSGGDQRPFPVVTNGLSGRGRPETR